MLKARYARSVAVLAIVTMMVFSSAHFAEDSFHHIAQADPASPVLSLWPAPITNAGLQLPVRGLSAVSTTQLAWNFNTVQTNDIGFNLVKVPSLGKLQLSTGSNLAKMLAPGESFTQEDIASGRLTYQHVGNTSTIDSFDFRLHSIYQASVSSTGVEANQGADCADISDDGRYIAFYSRATNLVNSPSLSGSFHNIFVHDRLNGQTILASVAYDGGASNGSSTCLAMASNGRFVAFQSVASNLVPDDDNGNIEDIFLRDLVNNTTQRLGLTIDGAPRNGASKLVSISADGNRIAFQSAASNLVPNDTNGVDDIFLYDRQKNTNKRLSVGMNGTEANARSLRPSISADGRFVTFLSEASNLIPSDTNAHVRDMYIYDIEATPAENPISLVSISWDGRQYGVDEVPAAISADGRLVAFTALGKYAEKDTNNVTDVFIRDRSANTTTLASVPVKGLMSDGRSANPSISADGRFIVFHSDSTTLVPNDTNGVRDIFRYDRLTGTTLRISVKANGDAVTVPSMISGASGAAISADGRSIVFSSEANAFIARGSNPALADILVAELREPEAFTISVANSAQLSISTIPPQSTLENTTLGPLNFTVTSPTPESLQFSATSSNENLIPVKNIAIAGTGAQRSITIDTARTDARYVPNRYGDSLITIKVKDGTGLEVTTSFQITVLPPSWLVMLYLVGDDIDRQDPNSGAIPSLYPPIRDLESRLGSMPFNPNIRLVVLVDGNERLANGSIGDSRVKVRERDGWVDVTNTIIEDGTPWYFPATHEIDAGSASTLRDFITWSRYMYPSARYSMAALVDHGGGWAPDTDEAESQPRGIKYYQSGGWRGMSLDLTSDGGTSLSTRDTGEALESLTPLDVVFFDACSMSMIESAYEIRDNAAYLIAAQNLLFAELPYEDYLNANTLGATTTPQQLASSIVVAYNTGDGASSSTPFTIAALDLSSLRIAGPSNPAQRVDALAVALLQALPLVPTITDPVVQAIHHAYEQAQKFDYDASLTLDPDEGYVDLTHFALLLANSDSPAITSTIREKAQDVVNSVQGINGGQSLVVGQPKIQSGSYDDQPWNFDNAKGISIYLPLGERDYRPTQIDPNDPSRPASPERQLGYYSNTCPRSNGTWTPCQQLAFTGSQGAPHWAELLVRLEPTVTVIRSSENIPNLVGTRQSLDTAVTYNRKPFHTPVQITSALHQSSTSKYIYVPLLGR